METLIKGINNNYPSSKIPFLTILLPSNRAVIEFQNLYKKLFQNALVPNVITFFDYASNMLNIKKMDRNTKIFSHHDMMFFVNKYVRKNLSYSNNDQIHVISKEIIGLWNEATLSGKSKAEIIKILKRDKNISPFPKLFLDLTIEMSSFLRKHNLLDQKEAAYKDLLDLCNLFEEQPFLLKNSIILAGTTATIPAVRELASIISKNKNGQVILPGYNNLANSDFDETHPFYTQKKWMECENIKTPLVQFYEQNSQKKENLKKIFENSSKIAPCKSERFLVFETSSLLSEAMHISYLVRYHLENDPQKKITIVSANKNLIKLLQERFKNIGFQANSSLPNPLAQTPQGQFLRLLISFFLTPSLKCAIALLKNPLYAFFGRAEHLEKFEIFEKNIQYDDKLTLKKLYLEFDALKNPLQENQHCFDFLSWIEFIINSAKKLSSESFFEDEIGRKIYNFLDMLKSLNFDRKDYKFYSDVFLSYLLEEEFIPENINYHPNVKIIGTIESRHIQSDIVIVTDLNENSWPPSSSNNVWLDQRHKNELYLPEATRRLSLSAHDFLACLTAERVYLTRSKKIDGQLQERSRFLSRLYLHFKPSQKLLALKKLIENSVIKSTTIKNKTLPVTEVDICYPKISNIHQNKISISALELLNKDQYAYYIKYILSLEEKNEWFKGLSAVLLGKIVHDILETIDFSLEKNKIKSIIQLHLSKFHLTPYEQSFLENQLFLMLVFSLDCFQTNLPDYSLREEKLDIHIADHLIYGIADRIDFYGDTIKLIDYKTGILPSVKNIKNMESLQMPLLQAMLHKKKLKDRIENPQFWKLSGVKGKSYVMDLDIDEKLYNEYLSHVLNLLNNVPWNINKDEK